MANEITDPASDVAELVRHVLSPPSSGMGGGSLSEERSQMLWRDRCVADLRSMRAAFGPRGLAPELHAILDVCAKILRVEDERPPPPPKRRVEIRRTTWIETIKCDACGCEIDGEPRSDADVPGARLCRWARCMDGLEGMSPDERRGVYDARRSKKNT